MKSMTESYLLRIFIGESDRFNGRPLYEALVEHARKKGLSGATVTRGILGFGANSLIHTSKILRLSEDLPLIVEIVDSEANLEVFLKEIDPMMSEGLVTIEKVRAVIYRKDKKS